VTPRFFVAPDAIAGEFVQIDEATAHRIARVLRLKQGDHVELCDGSGMVYRVELAEVSPRLTLGKVIGKRCPRVEPTVHLTLYQAVVRERRMAWLLEKVTEIGVARIVPLVTEHTVRARNGEIAEPMQFGNACAQCTGLALICHTTVEAPPILEAVAKQAGARPSQIALFVGPEGGFSPAEVEEATRCNIEPVSLGRRIGLWLQPWR